MNHFNRRQTIGGAAALGAFAVSGCATPGSTFRSTKFGLADITVMKELLANYPATLRKVAALGYTAMGFRLYGYGGRSAAEPAAAEKARMVRDAGLEIGVVRLGVRNVDYDRDLDEAAATGARIVAMTTAPPFIAGPRLYELTREQFDAWLPQLQTVAEKAKSRGLILAYHNHWYDLEPLGGERPLDVMARSISPDLLSFEVDLAWTWLAGVAPLDLLAKLGPRVVSMHWKDVDRTRGKANTDHAVAPGEGEMDYARLLPQVRRATPAMGFVEVDSPADGLAAAASAARLIRPLLERAA